MSRVITGLDNALQVPHAVLTAGRLGLLTNPSGIDRAFQSTIDLFMSHSDFDLQALFGPEHGVRGEAQAGAHVADGTDPRTGLPVYSLYGTTQVPSAEMLRGIDTMVIDLQDIGVRYATYLSTVAHVLSACDAQDMPVVVLDRPNPLGGTYVAGNTLEPAFASFVGVHTIPTCHGLTIGEFARLWSHDNDLSAPVVIPMTGWRRPMTYDETGLPWVFPSPNLPTLDSIRMYPATCLIEGTTLSEGRGTTRPFEIIGAPWIEPRALARSIERRGLPGIAARPLYFTPTFSKHTGERCGGVQLSITDDASFDSVRLGVHLLAVLRDLGGDQFAWLPERDERFFIDLLCGTDAVRHAIDNDENVEHLLAAWNEGALAFEDRRAGILLYD